MKTGGEAPLLCPWPPLRYRPDVRADHIGQPRIRGWDSGDKLNGKTMGSQGRATQNSSKAHVASLGGSVRQIEGRMSRGLNPPFNRRDEGRNTGANQVSRLSVAVSLQSLANTSKRRTCRHRVLSGDARDCEAMNLRTCSTSLPRQTASHTPAVPRNRSGPPKPQI